VARRTVHIPNRFLHKRRSVAAQITDYPNPERFPLVQAMDRALLVDTLPSSAQASGNAWAARMLGVGSVVGFFVGNINLPSILPFLGKSQLQVLSVVVSLLLLGGHLVTAGLVKERVLLKNNIDGYVADEDSF
jgi:hypothetical protein